MKNIIFIIGILYSLAASAQIDPYLQRVINDNAGEEIPVVIILNDQWKADSVRASMINQKMTATERKRQTIKQVKAFTKNSQKPLLSDIQKLKANYRINNVRPFWAANIIALKASPDAIYALAKHSDIFKIVYDEPGYAIYPGEKAKPGKTDKAEVGLRVINARALWAMGYTGKGRIAMGIDTGIFPGHPAFGNRFLGHYFPLDQCWFGYNNDWPFDISDHGTHTMGTTLGQANGYYDTIGVAFNAYFIAADPIVSSLDELRTRSQIMESFQWALDPDGNPNTVSDVPDAINNSWGLSNSGNPDNCDMPATLVLNTVHTAGIAVIFSAGNDGPGSGTVGEPAHIARSTTNVFSVGALNAGTLAIAGFSSRGPTNCYEGPDTSLMIKPEVSAPGEGVYSCTDQSGYGTMSGTSMAAPHVTGAVLLLKEAFPEVPGDEILMALYNTATDLGDPGEDNVYGNGLINLEAAFSYLADTHEPAPPVAQSADPYCTMTKRQFVGPKTSYEIELTMQTVDESSFQIIELNLFYQDSPLAFDSVMVDSDYHKTITLQIDPANFNLQNKTHKITGVVYTNTENDDTINNRFWFDIYHPEEQNLPLKLTFENIDEDFSNGSVYAYNPDQFITWKVDTIDGFDDNSYAAKITFDKYTGMEGEKDYLMLPPVNIADADAPKAYFKHCYTKKAFNLFKDSLIVIARYGSNYENTDTLFADGGENLATLEGNYNNIFVPNLPEHWRDTTISLAHLQSYGTIKIEFISVNDNGNWVYVDNICLYDGEHNPIGTGTITGKNQKIAVYPNPAQTKIFVEHPQGSGQIEIMGINGNVVKKVNVDISSGVTEINLSDFAAGIYLVNYTNAQNRFTKKLIKY